nr:leucine-rich repeat protein [Tanacetum cinerariifolium]
IIIKYVVEIESYQESSILKLHFVRDLVAAGQVRVLHVPSRYQFADIFTKCLSSALFEEFQSSLSVRCPPLQIRRSVSPYLSLTEERHALLQFKHRLVDEGGLLASWVDEQNDCCKWAVIVCDNKTGHVHEIHLNGNCGNFDDTEKERKEAFKQQLKGELSQSMLNLKQLEHLDLSCNDFGQNQVPEFIGSIGNLRYLNLSRSNFGGNIPHQLGNLSQLHTLCLGSFQALGVEWTSVVNMEWLSNLRLLRHLDMSAVNLSKAMDWFQVINTLPSLAELHFRDNYLVDYLHPHVPTLNITSLLLLDLSGNQFTNSLMPKWIFSITSLVSLDLSYCGFSGSSAHSFRNLTSLKWLHVSRNTFMNSSLVLKEVSGGIGSKLISLDISRCDISSTTLDSLHNLTSLLSLDLSGNQLTNKLPKSLVNFCNLRDIDLSSNNFQNMSFTYLLESLLECKSPHLESLSIVSSRLYGTIPDSIGRLSLLEVLDLSFNELNGSLPDSIGRLSLLKISNKFVGKIPHEVCYLTHIQILDLSNNKLMRDIPKCFNNFSVLSGKEPISVRIFTTSFINKAFISSDSLVMKGYEYIYTTNIFFMRFLDLSNNKLVGHIPNSIGRLSLLEVLDISFNELNGSLPDSIGRFSLLKTLDLSNNQLNGSLPNSFGQLSKLEELYFSSNFLTGPQFPSWLIWQSELISLDISNTNISSPIPESFWRSFPNLESSDMSKNQMQGMVNLSGFFAFISLDLSSNRFGGKLPDISNGSFQYGLDLSNNLFVGSLHHLLCSDGVQVAEMLNLGNNSLSGVIPECWEKWQRLSVLNLENNNFSGGFPRTLGHAGNIESLSMRGNNLGGKLPASLMNLTYLRILELSGNELAGSILSWVGTKLSSLRLFNLRSNKFDGKIPRELCYLTHIQILDLSNNKLMGEIPKCFNNFSVLSGKETVSDNQFIITTANGVVSFSVPLVMKGHEYMYNSILKLMRNHLTGRILEKIGDLKELESFDLSLNKLSGELPMSLSSLNSLSSFNVSYNDLTGKIPSSTQLQSLNESCFVGNKLCGDPLMSEPCSRVKTQDTDGEEDDGSHGVDWGLIIGIVSGFVVGFWVILVPLIVSRSWRIAYFRFLNDFRLASIPRVRWVETGCLDIAFNFPGVPTAWAEWTNFLREFAWVSRERSSQLRFLSYPKLEPETLIKEERALNHSCEP